MDQKSPDAFRTISEVADWLGVPTHVLRFWESRFSQVKPVKRAGGRRYYRPTDMELLGGIRRLLHEDGMTIRGVQKMLREKGVKYIAAMSPPLDAPVTVEDITPSNVVDLTDRRESATQPESAPEPAPEPETPAENLFVDEPEEEAVFAPETVDETQGAAPLIPDDFMTSGFDAPDAQPPTPEAAAPESQEPEAVEVEPIVAEAPAEPETAVEAETIVEPEALAEPTLPEVSEPEADAAVEVTAEEAPVDAPESEVEVEADTEAEAEIETEAEADVEIVTESEIETRPESAATPFFTDAEETPEPEPVSEPEETTPLPEEPPAESPQPEPQPVALTLPDIAPDPQDGDITHTGPAHARLLRLARNAHSVDDSAPLRHLASRLQDLETRMDEHSGPHRHS